MSAGCGLPLFIQTRDFATSGLEATTTSDISSDRAFLSVRSRIEQFRLRVSTSLGSDFTADAFRETSSHYRPLNSELGHLESQVDTHTQSLAWYLCAARLHLHAFYLFDDASSAGYNDRIMELYQTAASLINLTVGLDEGGPDFVNYCPFFCSQVFVCAAFVVLKISTNSFFRHITGVEPSTQLLERSITALRRMSVVNNDIPARLSDVLAFFCALPDPATVGGRLIEDIRLKQVNTRLSMSVVHDFLRTWRSHFRKQSDEVSVRNHGGDMGDKFPPALLRYIKLTISWYI